MQNIPAFTTENGAASLILSEIPYRKTAYVVVQATQSPEKLLEECCAFCKALGAEHIYARGENISNIYPVYTTVVQMRVSHSVIPDTDAALFPVTEQTISRWREIYNDKMKEVPLASYMTERAGRELLEKGNGYFIHRGEKLLGIGSAAGDTVESVISVTHGAGKEVLEALCHALSADSVCVEVADTNIPAMRLYESMGFLQTVKIATWYSIL